jgi:hypothetical protein
MAAPTVLEVRGARQLRATLRRAGDDLEEMKAIHATVAGMVAAAAQSRAPRRTGRLAATVRPSGARTQAVVRAGYARVPYANPIHWGWPRRGIRPSLFLTSAAADTEPLWFATYTRAVDAILERIKGA